MLLHLLNLNKFYLQFKDLYLRYKNEKGLVVQIKYLRGRKSVVCYSDGATPLEQACVTGFCSRKT